MMKKFIVIFLFLGFVFLAFSVSAQEKKQRSNKPETTVNQNSKREEKKDSVAKRSPEIISDAQAEEQRKKEIEAKELSVNKNKKVRRFGVDENLPQMIQKRNIP